MYVGAHAIAPRQPTFVAAALVLASLMASTVASSRSAGISRAGIVTAATAIAIPIYAVGRGFGWLAWGVAVIAGVAFAGTLATTRAREDAPLDADARALAPIAAWIAIAAAVTRFGAEAVHIHRIVPMASAMVAASACLIAMAAAIVFVRQRAWTRRVYGGDERPLRVAALPEDGKRGPHARRARRMRCRDRRRVGRARTVSRSR